MEKSMILKKKLILSRFYGKGTEFAHLSKCVAKIFDFTSSRQIGQHKSIISFFSTVFLVATFFVLKFSLFPDEFRFSIRMRFVALGGPLDTCRFRVEIIFDQWWASDHTAHISR